MEFCEGRSNAFLVREEPRAMRKAVKTGFKQAPASGKEEDYRGTSLIRNTHPTQITIVS